MVFQNPYASLNPRQKIGDQLAEPLLINTALSREERREKVQQMMRQVGLRPGTTSATRTCSPAASASASPWPGR